MRPVKGPNLTRHMIQVDPNVLHHLTTNCAYQPLTQAHWMSTNEDLTLFVRMLKAFTVTEDDLHDTLVRSQENMDEIFLSSDPAFSAACLVHPSSLSCFWINGSIINQMSFLMARPYCGMPMPPWGCLPTRLDFCIFGAEYFESMSSPDPEGPGPPGFDEIYVRCMH